MKVAIAPDFEHLLPALAESELTLLEQNCLADPEHQRMPPVIVWGNHKNTIVDGHNQYRLRTAHRLKIKFSRMDFADRDEAMRYALDVQFGRRNLDASQRAIAYAKLNRNPHGGDRRSENQVANLPLDRLAEAAGVSPRTMRAAANVADHAAASIVQAVEAGEVAVSDAAAIMDLSKSEQVQALRAVEAGEAKTLREAAADAHADEPTEDAIGQRVPARLAAIFTAAEEFGKQSRALAAVKKWAAEVAETSAGSYLHLQSFAGQLTAAQKQLKFERPHAVCPYCLAKKAKCEACKGRGFVTKPIYDGAPSELRI